MKTTKIVINGNLKNKTIREILIQKNINPETVLIKINNQFIPISYKINKKTEIEIIKITK
ncbi:MAG TPA: hypothetical protein PKK56_02220 [archaeon]|jgi:sulfur carrier protein ThiS|nr:hypothetical protein [archaeon]HPC10181.1 hypothetical protein [archaeon]HRT02425.1 hypothetical protein [Candidatus Diapherotrites archaeon]